MDAAGTLGLALMVLLRSLAIMMKGTLLVLILWCGLGVAHPAAQERVTPTPAESPLAVTISADSNNGDSGSWLALTPAIGYTLAPRWSIEAGAPLYFLTAGASFDGVAAGGIGDVYGSLSFDMSPETATLYTTATVSAPTGSSGKGLGAGQTSWDWTTHVAGKVGRVAPYANAGLANNLRTGNESLSHGAGTARVGAGVSVGKLTHAEAGVEFDLTSAVTLSGSTYGVFRTVPAPAADQDEVSDHGLGLVLWGQLTPSLDVSLWLSHSLAYEDYTIFTISAIYTLTPRGASGRSGKSRP